MSKRLLSLAIVLFLSATTAMSVDTMRLGILEGGGSGLDPNAVHKWDTWDALLNVTGKMMSSYVPAIVQYLFNANGVSAVGLEVHTHDADNITMMISGDSKETPIATISSLDNLTENSNPVLAVTRLGNESDSVNTGILFMAMHHFLNSSGFFQYPAVVMVTDSPDNSGGTGVLAVSGVNLPYSSYTGVVNIGNDADRPAIAVSDSSQVCRNLNADLLDGYHASDILSNITANDTNAVHKWETWDSNLTVNGTATIGEWPDITWLNLFQSLTKGLGVIGPSEPSIVESIVQKDTGIALAISSIRSRDEFDSAPTMVVFRASNDSNYNNTGALALFTHGTDTGIADAIVDVRINTNAQDEEDDPIYNNTLWVNGSSEFNGDVQVDDDLRVLGRMSVSNLTVERLNVTNQTWIGDPGWLGPFIGGLETSLVVLSNEYSNAVGHFLSLNDYASALELTSVANVSSGIFNKDYPVLKAYRVALEGNNTGQLADFNWVPGGESPLSTVDIYTDSPDNINSTLDVYGKQLPEASQGVINVLNTGTRPAITVDDGSKICTNLNADMLDGYHDSLFYKTTEDIALGWQNLTAYPLSCATGKFVKAIGDTLTCATPVGDGGGPGDYILKESDGVPQSIDSTLYPKLSDVYDLGADLTQGLNVTITQTNYVDSLNPSTNYDYPGAGLEFGHYVQSGAVHNATVTESTFILNFSPDTNFGGDVYLVAYRTDFSGHLANITLRENFLSGLPSDIISDSLRLYAKTGPLGSNQGIRIRYNGTGTFDENTLTWDNQNIICTQSIIDTFTAYPNTWHYIDMDDAGSGWVNGTYVNPGFILIEPIVDSQAGIDWYSDDSAGNQPYYSLIYEYPNFYTNATLHQDISEFLIGESVDEVSLWLNMTSAGDWADSGSIFIYYNCTGDFVPGTQTWLDNPVYCTQNTTYAVSGLPASASGGEVKFDITQIALNWANETYINPGYMVLYGDPLTDGVNDLPFRSLSDSHTSALGNPPKYEITSLAGGRWNNVYARFYYGDASNMTGWPNVTNVNNSDMLDGYHASAFYKTTDKVANATFADMAENLVNITQIVQTKVNNATFADSSNNSANLGGKPASSYLTGTGMASEASYLYTNGSRMITGGNLNLAWGNITGAPAFLTSNGMAIEASYLYVNGTRAVTGGDLSLAWSNLTSYPAACSSGQYISALGDLVTCSTPTGGSGGGNYLLNESYGVEQSINSTIYPILDSTYDLGSYSSLIGSYYILSATYIKSNDPDANYGSNSLLNILLKMDGTEHYSLIYYDFSNITNYDIAYFYLRIYTEAAQGYDAYVKYDCSGSFNEDIVTWNTRGVVSCSKSSPAIGVGSIGYQTFDLTAIAKGWANKTIQGPGLLEIHSNTYGAGALAFRSDDYGGGGPYYNISMTKIHRYDDVYATTYNSGTSAGITNTTGFWMCKDATCTVKCQVQIRGGIITGCS